MDTSLNDVLAPGVAVVVSIATFVFTQVRTQRLDDRAAAKDTVLILATQNKALLDEIADLRARVTFEEQQRVLLENRLTIAEDQRNALIKEVSGLNAQLEEATRLIRNDVAENTSISRAALQEAHAAKHDLSDAIDAIHEQAGASSVRMDAMQASADASDVRQCASNQRITDLESPSSNP